ncbi:MAG: hypothetical protein QM647_08320 [Asticcacaulis sp.]|uniref:hypothetical protein n=1 Tax=Asticcacaulis sp. TaxID=1872648 RepID=UPI0039E66249
MNDLKRPEPSPEFSDDDIRALFAVTPVYDDAPAFQARVTRGLRMKLWLRQGVIALAGIVGGLYALAQFVRVPGLGSSLGFGGKGLAPGMAQVESGHTLRAGVEFFDGMGKNAVSLFDSSVKYLGLMQTPLFFWLSFSLCLVCLALYYAYSQEETI